MTSDDSEQYFLTLRVSTIILKISMCHLTISSVAKSIMSAICCGTMKNSANGYGVTMFMFQFAS